MLVSHSQTDVAEITRLEGERANAARNGMGVAQYYTSDYVGIAVTGVVPPNSVLLQHGGPQRSLAVRQLTVRVIGDAAFTRGVQIGGIPRTAPVRFLRVWRKEANGWKIAAFHATWMERARVPASRLREPPAPLPSMPPDTNDEAEAIKAHFALDAAFAARDATAIASLTSTDFVMVAADGVEKDRTSVNSQGTLLIDGLRARTIGSLVVLNYREIPRLADGVLGVPALVTRVFMRSETGWIALVSQHTSIADGYR